MNKLMEMLSYMRPHKSNTEKLFIQKYISCIPSIEIDQVGNLFLSIGSPTCAFTAHTDTVHNSEGIQKISVIDDPLGKFCVAAKPNILGADDATGIWLLLEMINAGIEGLYCFFRGEERGGIGSNFAASEPNRFKNISCMLSFDRKGYDSIITHQLGIRCCSERFSESLSGVLNMNYCSDDTGVFTDSAQFIHLIPECTNISVGYFNEHTQQESQNLTFAMKLRDKLIQADWSRIETPGFEGEAGDVISCLELESLVSNQPEAATERLYSMGVDYQDIELLSSDPEITDQDIFEYISINFTELEDFIDLIEASAHSAQLYQQMLELVLTDITTTESEFSLAIYDEILEQHGDKIIDLLQECQ